MAGHSKFKNIMHRKGAQDKKRAKVFTSYLFLKKLNYKMDFYLFKTPSPLMLTVFLRMNVSY